VPKRYTTQMYLYFLPLPTSTVEPSIGTLPAGADAVIPTPTSDGGVEHTAARFLPAQTWISMARSGEIILFPPQFFLLSIVALSLPPVRQDAYSNVELQQHRRRLEQSVKGGSAPLGAACISPGMIGQPLKDGRTMLSLGYPGSEVVSLGRQGLKDWVVILGRNTSGSPTGLEVKHRTELGHLLEKSNI
jgi:hypothetical protein